MPLGAPRETGWAKGTVVLDLSAVNRSSDPSKHRPSEAERDERVAIHTDLTPEEALRLLMEVNPESEPVPEETAERAKPQVNDGT